MKLKKIQLKLQEDSFSEVVLKNRTSIEGQKIALLLKKLSPEILQIKKSSFKEVVKKIIKEDSDEFRKLFNVELKNIENYISKYLANEIIDKFENGRFDYTNLDSLKKSNSNFASLDKENYLKIVDYLIVLLNDNYETINILKDKDQIFSYSLFAITSQQIAYIILVGTLQISLKSNDDEENTANSRQNIGDEFAEHLWNIVKYKYFRKILNKEIDEIDSFEWNPKQKQALSQLLIDILIDKNFLIEKNDKLKDKNYLYLELSKEFISEIQKLDKKFLNKINVTFKPMVVPPLKWTDIDDGGFLRDEEVAPEFKLLLIKGKSKQERKKIFEKRGQIPQQLLDAINHIQDTQFKINKQMLEVFQKGFKFKKKNKKLDSNFYKNIIDGLQKQKKHISIDNKLRNQLKKIIKNFKSIDKALIEYQLLYKMAKLRDSFFNMINIADEFKSFENIYFVWQIDFRGRIYPKQTLLNPQGGDIAKSLLLFSEKQKLNQNGIKWFKIHGANLYGEVDKEVFEKRISWIDENEENILNSAKDYQNCDFWKKADEPFEFLAFCFEYAKFVKDRENFYTSLPCSIDGSNNGLQHISTLLKDIESAKNVNVLPNDRNVVADVYNLIADGLKDRLEKEKAKFYKNIDKYENKDGFYYEEIEKKIEDKRMYADNLLQHLTKVEISNLKNKKISTYLKNEITDKEYKYLLEIENANIKYFKNRKKEIENSRLLKRIIGDLEEEIEEFKDDKNSGKSVNNKIMEKKKQLVEEGLIEKVESFINRSFVKNAVMTDSYGASSKSKSIAIKEKLKDLQIIIDKDLEKQNKILNSFALYLAKMIDNIIDNKIESSEKYKKWIKNIATAILENGNAIELKTPIGFIVSQTEYKTKTEYVSCGNNKKLKINRYTDKIDESEHKKGIAPNYIHSLDATHLYLTINSLANKGISNFLTIHDSFGTLPNDVEILSDTLKEEFVKLYSNNVLEDLIEFVERRFNLKLNNKKYNVPYIDPDRFNLEDIKKSPYFFA